MRQARQACNSTRLEVQTLSLADRHTSQIGRLYATSGAAQWGVSLESFTQALEASVARRWTGQSPSAEDVARYLDTLAVADIALACACRAGEDTAWEHFVREFRPALYAAARSIAGEGGRELADSLHADLFGIATDRPDRRSLFAYYHGRSSLATWLRAVLVRRHIDRLRETARTTPLDEPDAHPMTGAAAENGPPDPERSQYVQLAQHAIDGVIAGLEAGDRLRLRLYYGEGLTLAEIGRAVREHEATVSRKLNRLRRLLRERVEAVLRDQHGLNAAAIQACFDYAAQAPELHLTQLLSSGEEG
jgi:RNA polymerase sigma-70 factor (ECF subfamily)